MASKTWYAVTKIQHGKRTEDGSAEGKYKRTTFEPGDKVTGLTKEDMVGLYNAGAISSRRPEWLDDEEDEVEVEESPAKETPSEEAPSETSSTPAKKAVPAKKAAPAAAPPAPTSSGSSGS